MSTTQPTPLSMWPDEISEGDTIVFTGKVWAGEEFSEEQFFSWAITITEFVPESRYGGGFYATTLEMLDEEPREVFVTSDEYAERLAMVKQNRSRRNVRA